jgi:hypothetical protein
MNPQATVERFLTAFYTGNEDEILQAVVPEYQMLGPFATAHNARELIELSRPLFEVVRGVRVQRWVVEGDHVAALYEIAINGPHGEGRMTMGGWFTVSGDQVAEGHVVYDNETFHAVLSGK